MTNEELWQAVLAQIQLNISPANFATWFRNTKIISKKEGQVIISTPNSFVKEWLENKYDKIILKILHTLDEEIKEVNFETNKQDSKPSNTLSRKKNKIPLEINQLEFQELEIDRQTNLNPRYLFSNFIVGPFNELAHAAAFAVTKTPGRIYNPLFIYGGVGLGKTHLLQATGNEIIKNFSQKNIQYLPAEKFTSEIVTAIRNQEIGELKLKYQKVDTLILDDVHFLAGKEKTQEEFFHIFNALYEKNKQIILSSDRPPKAIPSLTERLRSRFEGGMIADISYPDYETRIAILKAKCLEKNVDFSEEILNYIAANIQKNIRELEGALNCLIVNKKLNNQPLEIEKIKPLLRNLISSPSKITNPKKIIQATAEFYDLKEKDLISPSRKKEVVKPRQIIMYLLRKELKCSFPFIGRKFGKRDHTTAIYAYKKISRQLEKNEQLVEEINLIKQRIFSG